MNKKITDQIRKKKVCDEISRLYFELKELYAKKVELLSILQQESEKEELEKIGREENETRIAIVNLEQIFECMEQFNLYTVKLNNKLNQKTQEALDIASIKIIIKPLRIVSWKE